MSDKKFTSKLPDVGTTIFTVMSAMAHEYGAHNLAQGFPEFEPDEYLKQRVSHYIENGYNQYAPMMGIAPIRNAISEKIRDYYGASVNPDSEITITSGATEALFVAIQAVIRPGDEVIVFDPAYDSYDPAVRLAGGSPIHIPLTNESFGIDWQRLADAINDKTRLIIINSPHNPTGEILTADDLEQLASLIEGTNCLVLSDEVYEHIIFDDEQHASVLTNNQLAEKSFVVSSFGKTYHMTGWKIGYCVAPANLMAEFCKVHQFVTFSTSTPMQYGIADIMQQQPDYGRDLAKFYQIKRDIFAGTLGDSKFKLLPCRGTYFQLLDYTEVSDLDDMAFTDWLTKEKGVATIPLSPFCEQPLQGKFIRCCFAKSEETLREVGGLLAAVGS